MIAPVQTAVRVKPPLPGDTQAAFVARSNAALKRTMPDIADRMHAIFREWIRAGKEQRLQAIAARQFPSDKFECVRSRPVFAEHSTINRDGKPATYGRRELELIVNACNQRILDTGDFAALTAGHTPESELSPMPEVLGYCGPYRLGIVGNVNPRWAVFCDEWHHREDAAKLRKLQRRSPEVWTSGPANKRFFDPIAALGAESPRIPLGLTKFHRTSTGELVEKYSAAYAGPFSTSVPGFGTPEKHSAGVSKMLAPEDIQQIVSAVMDTAPMQWVAAQMQQDDGQGNEPDGDEPGFGDEPPAAPEVPADPAADLDDEEKAKYASMDDNCKRAYMAGRRAYAAKYAADVGNPDAGDESTGGQMMQQPAGDVGSPDPRMAAKYSAIQTAFAQKARQLKAQESRLAVLEATVRHKERYAKLHELSADFEFDLDAEHAELRDATQAEFDRQCQRIAERYQRKTPNGMPYLASPGLDLNGRADKITPEKYSRAMAHIDTAVNNGKSISFDEAMALVTSGK